MNSKLWQSLPIITVFLFASMLLTKAISLLGFLSWKILMIFGAVFLIGGICLIFFLDRKRIIPIIILILDGIAYSFFCAAFFVGSKVSFSLLYASIGNLGLICMYLLIVALLYLPIFHSHTRNIFKKIIRIILCTVLIIAPIIIFGILLNQFGSNRFSFPLYSSIIFFFLMIGALIEASDFDELLQNLSIPLTISVFLVGIIILFALAGDGDCDCDGCDGFSCDCDGGYSSGFSKKKKGISMSDLSNGKISK